MATIAIATVTARAIATALRWWATKRAMGRVARAMRMVAKRAMAKTKRARVTATKRAITTDREGNINDGKSDGDGNK